MKKKIKERRIEVMEERRQKLAKQSEKRKEQLDLQLQEYGGLWRTKDEMKTNIDVLTAGKKKDALITQIKYSKFVLGSRPSEKSLLQLQHGKEKFTVEQLEENLETVIQGVTESTCVPKQVTVKERDEREEELSAAIERKSKKRKQQDEHLGFKMVGKTILYKWKDNGTEKWYTGKVIQAVGDVHDKCGFEVKYNDGDEQIVQLYKEPKEDLVFLHG